MKSLKSINTSSIALLLFMLFSSVIFGCKKETVTLSEGQNNQKAIQDAISKSNVTRVFVINDGDQFPAVWDAKVGNVYTFSNGFLSVSGYDRSFNLEYVKSYSVSGVTIENGFNPPTEEQAFVIVMGRDQK